MASETCVKCTGPDGGVTFRCWNCVRPQHVHVKEWADAPENAVLLVTCPGCSHSNAVRKSPLAVRQGLPFVTSSIQTELST